MSLEQGPARVQQLMARAPAIAASVLGGLGLMLACLGIYGVVSRLVSRRTREIGIRLALGAAQSGVIAMIGKQTLAPVAWGTVAGLVGAFGVAGLLRALIAMPVVLDLTYGAGALDPVTFPGVLLVLLCVVATAVFLPTRRATQMEPALRCAGNNSKE